ncbi:hypothetical protein U0C82_14195 [Fulvimarina sp. 2208YS6-2-32]|uniref:Uncharacterized protein n=1 Tax=Fulvimarina uroteuthidis TaxID=3098149 RepID=A0ABU5I5A6_9HYPH|nr:hypothetical protein [Fulvimarina sp. 2208YS6-2-32]MDY8110290.1 hypothetical protein [Fulvimarina sp. 2208YS6-2-32]
MAFARKLLADRSASAAIVLIVAQALVLIGLLQGHAGVSHLASRALEIATDICTDAGIMTMADGDHDEDCCDERHCAILCAQQASGVTLASDMAAGPAFAGLRLCRAGRSTGFRDGGPQTPGWLGSIGARDPPAATDLRRSL